MGATLYAYDSSRSRRGMESKMGSSKSWEVFQNLSVVGPASRILQLRGAMIERARDPWSRYIDSSSGAPKPDESDIVFFDRRETAQVPAARVVLAERVNGFDVPNIVPIGRRELTRGQYNSVLQDFAATVVRPAADQFGFSCDLSADREALADLVLPSTARALEAFSSNANKTMGGSHPLDQQRWRNFIFAAHNDPQGFDAEMLLRWLTEVESWSEDTASELARQFDFALTLLEEYDSSRG